MGYGSKRGLRRKRTLQHLLEAEELTVYYRFTFTLLLPATLATYDHHEYARLSYIITARAEGIGSATHFGALFKRDHSPSMADIPFREDFDHVIARSDKIAQEIAHDSGKSSGSSASAILPSRGTASPRGSPKSPSPPTNALHLTNPFAFDETASSPPEDSAIAIGDSPPTVTGLYHRSQSTDIQRTTSASADTRSIISVRSTGSDSGQKTEKQGWLKGDLLASRALVVHANIGPAGGVSTLDLRKEGFVEGLGSWRFSLSSDSVSCSRLSEDPRSCHAPPSLHSSPSRQCSSLASTLAVLHPTLPSFSYV